MNKHCAPDNVYCLAHKVLDTITGNQVTFAGVVILMAIAGAYALASYINR
jgi:hypothetical protein